MDVGMTALAIAAVLTLLRTVDEQKAIRGMPWGVIRHGDRRNRARVDAGKDPGHGIVHRPASPASQPPRRLRRLSRSAPASYPSTAARRASCSRRFCRWFRVLPRGVGGRRAAADRMVHEHWRQSRGPVLAFDRRSTVSGGSACRHRHAAPCSMRCSHGGCRCPYRRSGTVLAAVRDEPEVAMRVAILDDIHHAYEGTGGVRRLRERAEVRIFTAPFGDPSALSGFDALIANRERTRFTRGLLRKACRRAHHCPDGQPRPPHRSGGGARMRHCRCADTRQSTPSALPNSRLDWLSR